MTFFTLQDNKKISVVFRLHKLSNLIHATLFVFTLVHKVGMFARMHKLCIYGYCQQLNTYTDYTCALFR